MHSLNWRLQKLIPHQGDSFKTLDEWFNPELNQFMDEYFRRGTGGHRGQITRFTSQDYRQNLKQPDNKVWWHRQLAKRLFALRMAIDVQAKPIDRLLKATTPNQDTLHNHFWNLHNCLPHGGEWTADNQYLFRGKNPTGKPCNSRLCPWCWMRRFDVYLKACRTPAGYVCRSLSHPRVELNGLGYQGLVNVTSFDYVARVSSGRDPFLNESFGFYIPRAMKLFQQIRAGPLDPNTFRLMGPLYRETGVNGYTLPQVGVRIGFIHTDPLSAGVLGAVPGLEHYQNVTAEDAIRWTYPYPIGWLQSEDFMSIKLKWLTCFFGLSHHGIVRAQLPRIKNVPVHCELRNTGPGTSP